MNQKIIERRLLAKSEKPSSNEQDTDMLWELSCLRDSLDFLKMACVELTKEVIKLKEVIEDGNK